MEFQQHVSANDLRKIESPVLIYAYSPVKHIGEPALITIYFIQP